MTKATLFLFLLLGRLTFGELLPDQIYRDREHERAYRVVGELGAGGFGKVYKVEDIYSGKTYALKTFKDGRASLFGKTAYHTMLSIYNSDAKDVFLVPELATIKASSDVGEIQVQVMEVMESDLAGLTKRIRLNEPTLRSDEYARRAIHQLHLFDQMLVGYQALKEHRVSHRDINPKNYFVKRMDGSSAYTLKLGDADLAIKPLEMSGDYQAIGTLSFMAPETVKIRRNHELTSEADLFAIAGSMFYSLTGKTIYQNDGIQDMGQMGFLKLLMEPGRYERVRKKAETTLEALIKDFNSKSIRDPKIKRELQKELGQYKDLIMAGLQEDPKERAKEFEKLLWVKDVIARKNVHPILASVTNVCSLVLGLMAE